MNFSLFPLAFAFGLVVFFVNTLLLADKNKKLDQRIEYFEGIAVLQMVCLASTIM